MRAKCVCGRSISASVDCLDGQKRKVCKPCKREIEETIQILERRPDLDPERKQHLLLVANGVCL